MSVNVISRLRPQLLSIRQGALQWPSYNIWGQKVRCQSRCEFVFFWVPLLYFLCGFGLLVQLLAEYLSCFLLSTITAVAATIKLFAFLFNHPVFLLSKFPQVNFRELLKQDFLPAGSSCGQNSSIKWLIFLLCVLLQRSFSFGSQHKSAYIAVVVSMSSAQFNALNWKRQLHLVNRLDESHQVLL